MDMDATNRWLTLLANVGVIVGLVFLALQIRQSTEVARSSVDMEVTTIGADFHLRVAENPALARVVMIGRVDPSALSDEEKVQYEYHATAVFLLMEGAYKQYQRGFLPESGWKPYEDLITYFLANEIILDWWVNGSTVFSPEFEAVVEQVSGVPRRAR